jgi:hypothetical protein
LGVKFRMKLQLLRTSSCPDASAMMRAVVDTQSPANWPHDVSCGVCVCVSVCVCVCERACVARLQ